MVHPTKFVDVILSARHDIDIFLITSSEGFS